MFNFSVIILFIGKKNNKPLILIKKINFINFGLIQAKRNKINKNFFMN